jgi:hypothetical protein
VIYLNDGSVQRRALDGVTLRQRQNRIVGVSGSIAADEGRAIGNIQRGADPKALHEVGVGDMKPAETDRIREVAATRLEERDATAERSEAKLSDLTSQLDVLLQRRGYFIRDGSLIVLPATMKTPLPR